ncbi:MAG: endopeptidase La [Holosporales bacterium]|jgi:ATP-dependent Lon protease|nr:endopeptidase La [Holosporales bacterium]
MPSQQNTKATKQKLGSRSASPSSTAPASPTASRSSRGKATKQSTKARDLIPVLTLRDIVIFPEMKVPLFVGRSKSVAAIRAAINSEQGHILLLTQHFPTAEVPTEDNLYSIGTLGKIDQFLDLPDGNIKVLISGVTRARAVTLDFSGDYVRASIEFIPDIVPQERDLASLRDLVLKEFTLYAKFNTRVSSEFLATISGIKKPSVFADSIISALTLPISEKQHFLEMQEVSARLETLFTLLESENDVYNVEKRIRGRVKKQIEKTQREYYLNEQLRAIHKELGTAEDVESEIKIFEERIKKTKFSAEARERAISRLKKLRVMNASSSEANVVRCYLEWLLDIPWGKNAKTSIDLERSEQILNRDHYGLKTVKERILEHLAVQLRVKIPGQILCFVGPPGVGKTSLGCSIAEATGRSFVKMSLGGVCDESEIRGHRSTYIGAMPGKIIQGMKKAKTSNPLFLLDEIDKLGRDWRGDPMSALLEVLDPEQNSAFNDHYIEIDYDLSNVMFIATANSTDMPQPLLDRMELIRIPGYTEDEKIQIAEKHLIPKQMKLHGLLKQEFSVTDEVLVKIAREYTREAGVRNFERKVAALARKSVKEIMINKKKTVSVNADVLRKFCGVPKYSFNKQDFFKEPGVSTGLAWTESGGEIMFVEVLILSGKGNIIQTGSLGAVMKESIQASISYIRSKSALWGISTDFFEKNDIHVHVPEGATPKDGPSAGTAICTALTSALTKVMVRSDVAMTGEVNLRGQVSEIGGLKEKLLAAHRVGIKKVLIPKDNDKDLEEIDEKIKNDLTIVPVLTVDEALRNALVEQENIVF